MKTARVAYRSAIHSAAPHPAGLQLTDGRVLAEQDVVWLPPFEGGTIIALGLNYADPVAELRKDLTVTAQDEPLVVPKGPGSLIGHRGETRRPAGGACMHCECELAVVIDRTAKSVEAADAMAHVAGCTVCTDYAIRDCLENWYRPNLRVKNRNGGTVPGPWLVDAAEVPDPHALGLRTFDNGRLTQQGSTANMLNRIPNFDDADLGRALDAAVFMIFSNNGECMASAWRALHRRQPHPGAEAHLRRLCGEVCRTSAAHPRARPARRPWSAR